MDNHMDNIISQLSHIEDTAVRIMESAENQKKELEQEMKQHTLEFDQKLEIETQRRLEEAQGKLNSKKDAELLKATEETTRALEDLDAKYAANHNTWAREIMNSLIGE